MKALAIWCNARLGEAASRKLAEGIAGHRLILASNRDPSVLAGGNPDPAIGEADVAFGQPNPSDLLRYERIRWVQLSTAGYTRYDTAEMENAFRSRGAILTKASEAYAEPVAEHGLAMMLAAARNLLPAHDEQRSDRGWRMLELRRTSSVLQGSTVLFLGFGAIARRMAELLAPFRCEVYAVRRQIRSERGVRVVPEEDLTRVLAVADHVVNVLPESEATRNWVNARRLECFRPGARFYNLGRGATVDSKALAEALRSGRLASAYLDVTDPEPLPPDHPLWTTPHCYITPHTAGGRNNEDEALVEHFLRNLAAFAGGTPLVDRVY